MAQALTTTEYIICTDCALWAANRDDSGSSDSWAPDADTLAFIGTLIVSNDEPSEHFSFVACEGCGDSLGGDRMHAVTID